MEKESDTRRERIDPRLKSAGWHLEDYSGQSHDEHGTATREWPTSDGPCDYALWVDSAVEGVVEAKKLETSPVGVLTQSERYSKGMQRDVGYANGYMTPFLYSTNGPIIRFRDVRSDRNLSRELSAFHTPAALAEMLRCDFDQALDDLRLIEPNEALRDYQVEANTQIEKAIGEGRRKMLLTMATGTGKTLTTVSEIYRLMKSGIAKRVVFLVDRRALAAQAVRAFSSYEAEPGLKFDQIYPVYSQKIFRDDIDDGELWNPNSISSSTLENPKAGDSFVYVCTIQRLARNLYGASELDEAEGDDESDAEKIAMPIHAFDLVVADECHRGYSAQEASAWRDTLNYFDAIRIGLTATPAAHTLAYFEHIAYRYEYERAVREGHLVDYDIVRLRSGVLVDGVFLNEGEQVDIVDPESGTRQLDFLEDERAFGPEEVEDSVTVPDSNRKILEEIKQYADEYESRNGRFPKILIFAANDLRHVSHADQITQHAREIFARGEEFVTKITGRTDRPLRRIREFRNRSKPGVAVSVDLMSTGVDIPDLEFIVLLRPVKSRILFEQILGRGTRKGDGAANKDHFVVFDCFNGSLFEYFKSATGMTIDPPQSRKSIKQIIREIWDNTDRAYNTRVLSKRLQRIDKSMSGLARDMFARFIPEGDVGRFAATLPKAIQNHFSATMSILRDGEFQSLLLNYPRPPKSFLVAASATDHVSSELAIRSATGEQYKPEDYLKAFERFIASNRDQIAALRVILGQPDAWTPALLQELRRVLNQAPEHFTEENLRRAFNLVRTQSVLDLISMVKSGALRAYAPLTAEERVDRAVTAVVGGRTISSEQARWFDYIRRHLVENLSIDESDFSVIPLFADRGGWVRANEAFNGELDAVVVELNREVAAA